MAHRERQHGLIQVSVVRMKGVMLLFFMLPRSQPMSCSHLKEIVMSQSSILGLVALAVGALLLFFAWRAANAPLEQVSEALTGRYSGGTMWYLVGGVIGVVAGVALLYRGYSQN
jgi:hypothetical protein